MASDQIAVVESSQLVIDPRAEDTIDQYPAARRPAPDRGRIAAAAYLLFFASGIGNTINIDRTGQVPGPVNCGAPLGIAASGVPPNHRRDPCQKAGSCWLMQCNGKFLPVFRMIEGFPSTNRWGFTDDNGIAIHQAHSYEKPNSGGTSCPSFTVFSSSTRTPAARSPPAPNLNASALTNMR